MIFASILFIFPSLSEGLPRVLYEAMIHSIPIITTDVGGVKYLLRSGQDALLIRPKNADQIFQKFCLLTTDKALRQKLIINSRKKVQTILFDKPSEQFFRKIIECSQKNYKDNARNKML